jgi:hypothetical protein
VSPKTTLNFSYASGLEKRTRCGYAGTTAEDMRSGVEALGAVLG